MHQIEALELIFKCLNPNPMLRPTIEDIIQHEWIRDAPKTLSQELKDEYQKVFNLKPHPDLVKETAVQKE